MDERARGSRQSKVPRKPKRCSALCCSCRLSVSSSEDVDGSECEQFDRSSSIWHAMVQERLEKMIKGQGWRKKKKKCIMMVAMDKYSYEPREDFRVSMVEVITKNRIEEARELRCLLNCYMSMNSEEHRPMILETFHEVCTKLFRVVNASNEM